MSHKLSKSAQNLTGQPMFRMLSKIQEIEKKGKKILHFELGDPDDCVFLSKTVKLK